jgi:hypothetical protein
MGFGEFSIRRRCSLVAPARFSRYSDLFYDKKRFDDAERIAARIRRRKNRAVMASSMSFESSLSNALTDALTSLPNQRAFFSGARKSNRRIGALPIEERAFDTGD